VPAAEPAGEILALPPRVDAAAAAQLHRAWAARVATLGVIDLAAVQSIDSAGVALVHVLQARARAAGRSIALRAVPPRFEQLCLAHRIAVGGH
jgi:ABC-type transporter Mla MlaB component